MPRKPRDPDEPAVTLTVDQANWTMLCMERMNNLVAHCCFPLINGGQHPIPEDWHQACRKAREIEEYIRWTLRSQEEKNND